MATKSKKSVTLTDKQQLLYDTVVKQRRNVFFTGCGGTGKSFIISLIVKDLRDKLGPDSVAVTASTGRAAFNVQGTTLHKFSGLGLAEGNLTDLANRARFNGAAKNRWRSTKVLIVDEVSMISGDLFDKFEYVARSVRGDDSPFGGIQLILVGDLLQLPPVSINEQVPRIFQAKSWDKCIAEYVTLNKVFRQSDTDFIKALTCIRVGAVNDIVTDFINKVSRPITYEEDIEPVNLYATRYKTNAHNYSRLNSLSTTQYDYKAIDKSSSRNGSKDSLLDSCPAPKELNLRVGAQVMLVKNVNSTLVNGTVGTVTRFITNTSSTAPPNHNKFLPIVKFTLADNRVISKLIHYDIWETRLPDGKLQCSRCQLPLILAWAVTIHKSQSQTIQRLKVDLDGVFEVGQVYTAISRAVGMDTLEVLNFTPDKVAADIPSLEFCFEYDLL